MQKGNAKRNSFITIFSYSYRVFTLQLSLLSKLTIHHSAIVTKTDKNIINFDFHSTFPSFSPSFLPLSPSPSLPFPLLPLVNLIHQPYPVKLMYTVFPTFSSLSSPFVFLHSPPVSLLQRLSNRIRGVFEVVLGNESIGSFRPESSCL